MHRTLFMVTATCLLIAACSSAPPKAATASPASEPKPITAAAAPVAATAPVETDAQKMARAIKVLASNSVYFDYDDYSIKPQYQDLIKQNYQLLMASPKLSVKLAGNADERGSSEYNLALGQKRAESVKRALKLLGVPEAQLEAISYGKEKPRATCHEEKCWAENRRVDFASEKSGGR